MIELRPSDQVPYYRVNEWRIGARESLRTSDMQTDDQQRRWQTSIPDQHRYWSLWAESADGKDGETEPVGFGGLTRISWEDGHAEISLILDPDKRGSGRGMESVDAIFEEAFGSMRLHMIYGECYYTGAVGFWERVVAARRGTAVDLPARKFWRGTYYAAYHFSVFAP